MVSALDVIEYLFKKMMNYSVWKGSLDKGDRLCIMTLAGNIVQAIKHNMVVGIVQVIKMHKTVTFLPRIQCH